EGAVARAGRPRRRGGRRPGPRDRLPARLRDAAARVVRRRAAPGARRRLRGAAALRVIVAARGAAPGREPVGWRPRADAGKMLRLMRVALAQINTTVGAHAANAAKIAEWSARAADRGADLVLFPELAINGYSPADLVELGDYVAEGEATLHDLARRPAAGPLGVVGFVAE